MADLLRKITRKISSFETRKWLQTTIVPRFLQFSGLNKNTEIPQMVEFFFYSKLKEDALHLKEQLQSLGYEVYDVSKSKDKYATIGCTPPISIAVKPFRQWIEKMNELAFINDSDFDGWGMLADPDDL